MKTLQKNPEIERANKVEKLAQWLYQKDAKDAKDKGLPFYDYRNLQHIYLNQAGSALNAIEGPTVHPFDHVIKNIDPLSEAGKPGV